MSTKESTPIKNIELIRSGHFYAPSENSQQNSSSNNEQKRNNISVGNISNMVPDQPSALAKIIVIVLTVYVTWIVVGILWYRYFDGFTFATAYYYTVEAGLSIGFCYPSEVTDQSRIFTVFFVMTAGSLISGSLAGLMSQIVTRTFSITPDQHRHGLFKPRDEYGNLTLSSVTTYIWFEFKYSIGWYSPIVRSRIVVSIIFLITMAIGTAYGVLVEKYSVISALYW